MPTLKKRKTSENEDWKNAFLAFSAIGNLIQSADRKNLSEILHLTRQQVEKLFADKQVVEGHLRLLRNEFESLRTKALGLEELNVQLNKRVKELEKEMSEAR